MQFTRESGMRRLLAIGALFFSPVAVLFFLLAITVSLPLILLLYIIIIVEGIALILWSISKIRAEESSALLAANNISVLSTNRLSYYHSQRNRAEALTDYVKSASKRRSSYYREHSRSEIARVLARILEESPSFPPPNQLLVRQENSGSNDLSNADKERRVIVELDFLLHPTEGTKKKHQAKGLKRITAEEKPKPIDSRKRSFDYLLLLDHVLKEIDSNG